MSRTYGMIRPKRDRTYTVEDVQKLYSVTRNTITNWINAGLKRVDEDRPQLFRGAELKRFHCERALKTKRKLRMSEFKCTACKARVTPSLQTIRIERSASRTPSAWARCPECGASVIRLLNDTTCNTYQACINTNTSLHSLDEEEGPSPADIGKNTEIESIPYNRRNERIIHEYQLYAGRFSDKTLDAHLAAIRDFEKFNEAKGFANVTSADAARYRQRLVGLAEAGYSRSTIRHRAAYLTQFFRWLVQQDGYRRMNKTVCDNFQLSKKDAANAILPKDHSIPSLGQLEQILSSMPTRTLVERRDRAIVCAGVLFGTRASATASLRLHHVDVEDRKVLQDATSVRVKNSKSQSTHWFPVGGFFDNVIIAWINELRGFGLGDKDSLFPPDYVLSGPLPLCRAGREPVQPWATEEGIRRAFKRGCACAQLPYFNPHSARHLLAALSDIYCRTSAEKQAWSYNLGHSSIKVTDVNYNKMTDARRDAAFGDMGRRDPLPEEDKDLLLQLFEHQLTPGTFEHERATELSLRRQAQRRQSQHGGAIGETNSVSEETDSSLKKSLNNAVGSTISKPQSQR